MAQVGGGGQAAGELLCHGVVRCLFFLFLLCVVYLLVIELVCVPSVNIPFSVDIADCQRPALGESTCPYDKLVDVKDVVEKMLCLIRQEIVVSTKSAQRGRPLMISRLARGGKTTLLSLLFDELKCQNVDVMFITFNGSSNFQSRQGESQRNAILRVIATQLVEIENSDALYIECDEKALDKYIGDSPFVLLIDELNALAAPVDAEAGRMLRQLFLDKHNRCLVFTTHVPMNVEPQACHYMATATVPSSPRGCLTVPFHPTLDITSIRKMSDMCSAITPAEVMLYGGIPSLIYSVKVMNEMSPEVRFFKNNVLHSCDPGLLKSFVSSVVRGQRTDALARFDEFSTVSEEDRIRWPLCYIACILKTFELNEATHAVCEYCDSLSKLAQETESGKEWECVLNIAIIFRCLYQAYYGSDSPFSIVPLGTKPTVKCRTLPPEIITLPAVMEQIAIIVNSERTPCLLVLVPSYSKFPDVDGFVVYYDVEHELVVCGYQAKTGRGYPKKEAPQEVTRALLLRGKAPAMGSLRKGWEYMSSEYVQQLLGYSLVPMYPHTWPDYYHPPNNDGFD